MSEEQCNQSLSAKLKRFLVFSGDTYYPRGGADDYQGSFDTIAEVLAFGKGILVDTCSWANMLDTETGETLDLGSS